MRLSISGPVEFATSFFHHFEHLALTSAVTIEHAGSYWFTLPRKISKFEQILNSPLL